MNEIKKLCFLIFAIFLFCYFFYLLDSNEILEINKIDSHKSEVEYTSFNLKKLLEDIKHSLKELAVVNRQEQSRPPV